MARFGEWFASAANAVGAQLVRVLLAPGSTFSLPMLALSLAAFGFVAIRTRRGRHLPMRTLIRILMPRRLFGTASGRADMWFAITGISVTGVAIGWTLVSAEFVRATAQPWLGAPAQSWLPGWAAAGVATAILFLVYEFAYWLDHYLMHRVPWLWHFHKVHHQAESLSLLTNFRVHPVETIGFANLLALMLGLAQALLLAAFGTAATPLGIGGTNLLLIVTAATLTHLQHSHFWITLGPRWGRWLLAPAHHQIHHSDDPRHFNRNLGDTLAIFDRLFGTFWMPAPTREVTRFGVDDGTRSPHGVRAALLDPFTAVGRDAIPAAWPLAQKKAIAS